MRFSALFLAGTLLSDVTVNALVVAPSTELALHQPIERAERDDPSYEELWKRRGGGGGGGRGGGGGSSSGSSGSSSGSGRGGSGGGSSSGTSSGGRGGSSDSSGGRTTTGTGPRPAYGGGAYYGGGARVPYKSGGRSPSGMVPLFAGVAFLAVFPGLWLSGAYLYHYHNPYRFYNQTSAQDETKPVTCACEPEKTCGCDENGDNQYMTDLIGNGSYHALNHTLITVADIDGNSTIVINGTLPTGTTAAGGTDEPGSGATSAGSGATNAGDGLRALLQHAGWWPAAAAVAAIVLTA